MWPSVVAAEGIANVRVVGLGYDVEYFTLNGHEVVHAAVPHVDPQVRAAAPVWLPNIAPTPLCGLGTPGAPRRRASRREGQLCRACHDHLRELDEWVRLAEFNLAQGGGNGHAPGVSAGGRIHAMPF